MADIWQNFSAYLLSFTAYIVHPKMSDKQAKSDRMQVRISPEAKAMLKELAAADARTPSGWFEAIIRREHAKLRKTRRQSGELITPRLPSSTTGP